MPHIKRVRPFGVFVGTLLILAGAWTLLVLLPAHELPPEVDRLARFLGDSPAVADRIRFAGWSMIVLGLVELVFYGWKSVKVDEPG